MSKTQNLSQKDGKTLKTRHRKNDVATCVFDIVRLAASAPQGPYSAMLLIKTGVQLLFSDHLETVKLQEEDKCFKVKKENKIHFIQHDYPH